MVVPMVLVIEYLDYPPLSRNTFTGNPADPVCFSVKAYADPICDSHFGFVGLVIFMALPVSGSTLAIIVGVVCSFPQYLLRNYYVLSILLGPGAIILTHKLCSQQFLSFPMSL